MKLSTGSLARSAARHPWRTIVVWIAALLTAGVLSSQFLGDALTTDTDFTNEPEAKRAAALLEERLRGPQKDMEFVVVTAGSTVTHPDYRAYVGELRTSIAALGPDVVDDVGSYLTDDGPVSESGRSTLLPVTLAGGDHDAVGESAVRLAETVKNVEAPEGFEALVAGPATLENEFIRLAEEGLQQGETVGLAAALVVLVFVFGAVVAGLVPILLAVMSIAIALGAAALFGLAFDLPFFIANIITMIGLAVGIDYSLFIVSRYREERAERSRQARCDRTHRRHGDPGRVLLGPHGDRGTHGHAAAPEHDLSQHRTGSDPRGDRCGRRLAHLAARRAGIAR